MHHVSFWQRWQEGDINCEEMYILLRHLSRGSWGAGSADSQTALS